MFKYFKKTFMVLFFLIFFHSNLFAARYSVTPDYFDITVSKVEVHDVLADADTWVLVKGDESLIFDIASVLNGKIGNYGSSIVLDPGTYDGIRLTMSRTVTIGATDGSDIYCTQDDVQAYYYDELDTPDVTGQCVVIAETALGNTQENGNIILPEDLPTSTATYKYELDIDDDDYFVVTLTGSDFSATPVTITAGQNKTIRINFDLHEQVIFNDNDFAANKTATINYPTISVQIS